MFFFFLLFFLNEIFGNLNNWNGIVQFHTTFKQSEQLKGALCSFGEEISTQDFDNYSYNEIITEMQIFFSP